MAVAASPEMARLGLAAGWPSICGWRSHRSRIEPASRSSRPWSSPELDPPLNLQGMTPTPVRAVVTRLRRRLTPDGPRLPRQKAQASSPAIPSGSGRGPDMRWFLSGLVGRTIPTLSGRPNRILGVTEDAVLVGSTRSPEGRTIPLAWVQQAADDLFADGEIDHQRRDRRLPERVHRRCPRRAPGNAQRHEPASGRPDWPGLATNSRVVMTGLRRGSCISVGRLRPGHPECRGRLGYRGTETHADVPSST